MESRPPLIRRTIVQQIRDDLRDRIRSGEIATGAKLPSEPECCKIYGVSRATAREAYRLLEQEGLLETRHGAGRFVRPGGTVMVQGSVNLVQSTLAILEELGHRPRIEVVGLEERKPSAEEAEVFGIDAGDDVVEVERAYLSGDELLTRAVNVLDVATLPKPLAEMDWSSSVAKAFGDVGREISSGYTDISAAVLPRGLQRRFEVPRGAAWLRFDGPLFDQHGKALWWSHELWRSDVRTLRVVNRREERP